MTVTVTTAPMATQSTTAIRVLKAARVIYHFILAKKNQIPATSHLVLWELTQCEWAIKFHLCSQFFSAVFFSIDMWISFHTKWGKQNLHIQIIYGVTRSFIVFVECPAFCNTCDYVANSGNPYLRCTDCDDYYVSYEIDPANNAFADGYCTCK